MFCVGLVAVGRTGVYVDYFGTFIVVCFVRIASLRGACPLN